MEKILYKAMLSQIQKQINNEKDGIMEFQKKDNEYCNIKIETSKLLEIIEYYKELEIEEIKKDLIIYCNGNPYTVLNIILLAIIKNCNIKINIDNTMLWVNKYILEIVKEIIKAHNLKIEINFIANNENFKNNEKIICIDRMNKYSLIKNKGGNVKFISYKGIDIYLESDKYEDLFEKIYEFAYDQNIDIDVFNDESIESMLKYGKNKTKIVLTDNKETIEKYKDEKIYINENPFKENKNTFDEEIIKDIFTNGDGSQI